MNTHDGTRPLARTPGAVVCQNTLPTITPTSLAAELQAQVPATAPTAPCQGLQAGHRYAYQGQTPTGPRAGLVYAQADGSLTIHREGGLAPAWVNANHATCSFTHAAVECPPCGGTVRK